RFRESLFLAPEDLHAKMATAERWRELVDRLFCALEQGISRQELGDGEADAELLADGPKRQIGDRRHRREQDIRRNLEISDLHCRGGPYRPGFEGGASARPARLAIGRPYSTITCSRAAPILMSARHVDAGRHRFRCARERQGAADATR